MESLANPGAASIPASSRSSWGRADALAIAAWTAAIVVIFRDAALMRGALFYFDITEINYPYRAFLFRELAAGRFSRWLPDLYCGMPLYSESQAGYLHPLKYFLYPWMTTWKAFNLDTVASVWLAGLGSYGWLRRHVGAVGALAGAGIVALGGYTWAHLVHTSMMNALISVPLALWALESAWDRAGLRAVALGAIALAVQVFAGHLQDTILTSSALGVYAIVRAAHERSLPARGYVLGTTAGMIALAGLLSAVQWVPSKELLDRSPRAGGLTWENLTYGSWHPQLLPALLVHEAYGTRARDTDWMDGYYPYHEMDSYLGVAGLFLAATGAQFWRDRWVGSWLVMAAIGSLLMLGRHTFLMDFLHHVPIVGSSRIPVRFHLWVTLATAALAAVGVDRLARPRPIRLRGAAAFLGVLIVAALVILAFTYRTVWTEPGRWTESEHRDKFGWLGRELSVAAIRNVLLLLIAAAVASKAARSARPRHRSAWASILPVLAIVDMAAAHSADVPTIDPSYWTTPPPSVVALRNDPSLIRMYGEATTSSGKPGYASRPVDFLPIRETIAWSLPAVWDLPSTGGETPLISGRRVRFGEWSEAARHSLEGLSHIVSATPSVDRLGPFEKVGAAFLHRNPVAVPRVRLVGRPVYAEDERSAVRTLRSLGAEAPSRIVVEDPDRPLPPEHRVSGTARLVREVPERVEIRTEATMPAYLLLADTFDPGWTATVDGRAVRIRPANVAFRAVLLPPGTHTVVFSYRPAGFREGAAMSLVGVVIAGVLMIRRRSGPPLEPEHGPSRWPFVRPIGLLLVMAVVIAASAVGPVRGGRAVEVQPRWSGSFHPFTWPERHAAPGRQPPTPE